MTMTMSRVQNPCYIVTFYKTSWQKGIYMHISVSQFGWSKSLYNGVVKLKPLYPEHCQSWYVLGNPPTNCQVWVANARRSRRPLKRTKGDDMWDAKWLFVPNCHLQSSKFKDHNSNELPCISIFQVEGSNRLLNPHFSQDPPVQWTPVPKGMQCKLFEGFKLDSAGMLGTTTKGQRCEFC